MADLVDPNLALATNPSDVFTDLVDGMQAAFPGWEPNPANPDTQLLLLLATLGASLNQTAGSMLTSAFRYFGLYLVPNAQPEDAVPATGTVTITFTDTAAHTIDAGTTYGVQLPDRVLGFEIVDDVTHAAGTDTEAGVDVIAAEAGTDGNGHTGTLIQVDSLGYVESVVLDAATDGGVDEEDDPTYLDRLRAKLQRQAPRPIVRSDFAEFPKDIPGVERALAIDGYDPADHASYDPDDPGTWKERFVTVSAVDDEGEDVGAAVRTEIDAMFNGDVVSGAEGLREVNFVVEVEVPTYTTFDVNFSHTTWPTFAPADVTDEAEAAVAEYLSPANWGNPDSFGEGRAWEQTDELSEDGLYAALRAVPGIRKVTALTFRKGAAAFASTPVALDGAPGPVLTRAGTITGTAV